MPVPTVFLNATSSTVGFYLFTRFRQYGLPGLALSVF